MTTLLFCLLAALVAALLTWLYARSTVGKSMVPADEHRRVQQEHMACSNALATARAECSASEKAMAGISQQLSVAQNSLATALGAARSAEQTVARLESDNAACAKLLSEQKAFVETIRGEMERQFRLIAHTTLDENSRRIAEQQKEKLESTLQPFRDQIDAFRKQVDEKFIAEIADRNSLKGELDKVFTLTNTLTDQTNKLTNALTTHNKAQGNFGEGVLEMILVNAGMVEGEHYEKQYATTNEDGVRIIPDVILHCPDGYSLVVDSKVSLTHYLRYCNEVLAPEDEKSVRKEIYQSFKNHIDGLSVKKYERIARCADFVLMFAPVESAFTVAAQHDGDIRHYAFNKKVFLVTPSNLLLVVRMIGDLWQKDRVNKEAHAMADRARTLYEKACAFLESFTQVGASLEKAQAQFEKATGQLSGHGGLVRQGEMLQDLIGKRTSKVLPEALVKIPDWGSKVSE